MSKHLQITFTEPLETEIKCDLKHIQSSVTDGAAVILSKTDEGFLLVKSSDEKYLLKLGPAPLNSNKFSDQFYYEFKVGSHLSKLNKSIFTKTFAYSIVYVKGYGPSSCIIQEYVHGHTLQYLIANKQIKYATVIESFVYFAEQMKNVESTHYDLHFENILVPDPKNPKSIKVIDFGRSYAPFIQDLTTTYEVYCSGLILGHGFCHSVYDPYYDFACLITFLFQSYPSSENLCSQFLKGLNSHYECWDLSTNTFLPYSETIRKQLEPLASLTMWASPQGWTTLAYNTSSLPETNLSQVVERTKIIEKDYHENYSRFEESSKICFQQKYQTELLNQLNSFKKHQVNLQEIVIEGNSTPKKLSPNEFIDWFRSILQTELASII